MLCFIFNRLSDWPVIEALCRGVNTELDLPAPAVSVDGQGFRVWLSFAAAVDHYDAALFAALLQKRYLAELPAARRSLATTLTLPPTALDDAQDETPDQDQRWIAFIDPSLGGMFADEAWLAFPPEASRQADLLAGFRSIPTPALQRLLAEALIETPTQTPTGTPANTPAEAPAVAASAAPAVAQAPAVNPPPGGKITGPFSDPHSFLLAVINDPDVDLGQRLEAARALLPYASPRP